VAFDELKGLVGSLRLAVDTEMMEPQQAPQQDSRLLVAGDNYGVRRASFWRARGTHSR
jgi:hypothetical protein